MKSKQLFWIILIALVIAIVLQIHWRKQLEVQLKACIESRQINSFHIVILCKKTVNIEKVEGNGNAIGDNNIVENNG